MATYYINADTGNDTTGTGASGAPWLTLNKACTVAADGDTIVLQTATNVYASLTTAQSFTSKTLTFQGAARPYYDLGAGAWVGSVIGPAGGGLDRFNFKSITAQNLVFNGCSLASFSPVGQTWLLTATQNVVVSNCVVTGCTLPSVAFLGGFTRCPATYSVTLTGCLFYTNTVLPALVCLSYVSPTTVYIYNCVAYDQGNILEGRNTTLGAYLKNNIFRRTASSFGFGSFVDSTVNYTYQNNCATNYTGVPSGTGNITSDPLFIDPANVDFSLAQNSPCIGTGQVI